MKTNLKFQILTKKDRNMVNVELLDHNDYVYRWYNSMVDLGFIYEYDQLLHPAICRTVEVKYKDDKPSVYFKSRWCYEFCINGGLHKKKYIAAQFTTWELQEQIESGGCKVEYWLDKTEMEQAWEDLPGRKGKTTRDLIRGGKASFTPNKHGCQPEWNQFRAAGYSPLCCMCNENEKLLLESKE